MSLPPISTGVVLCRAGDHRMAFLATDVVAVEPLQKKKGHATFMAAERPGTALGRVLVGERGAGVIVDTLEIYSDTVKVLAVPALLRRFEGSLTGFIQVRDSTWPLFNLPGFAQMGGKGAL